MEESKNKSSGRFQFHLSEGSKKAIQRAPSFKRKNSASFSMRRSSTKHLGGPRVEEGGILSTENGPNDTKEYGGLSRRMSVSFKQQPKSSRKASFKLEHGSSMMSQKQFSFRRQSQSTFKMGNGESQESFMFGSRRASSKNLLAIVENNNHGSDQHDAHKHMKRKRSFYSKEKGNGGPLPLGDNRAAEKGSGLATIDLWNKVRGAVKIAGAINRITKETEAARRMRIKRHWDLVRQVARAAVSLNAIAAKRDESDSKMGIKNYTRFCRLLATHPSGRTDDDLQFLMDSTSKLAFFNDMEKKSGGSADLTGTSTISRDQHRELCRTMTLRKYESSHVTIFAQGDTGEEFFIILEGSVAVERKTGKAGVSRTVARMEAGGSFGELALSGASGNSIRTATIITTEPCTLLVINREDYARILQSTHQEVFDQKLRFLRNVNAFKDLPEKDIFNVGLCLHVHKERVGKIIVKEGEPVDPLKSFIIVKRGELEVRKYVSMDNTKQKRRSFRICLMGPTEAVCDYQSLNGKEIPNYTSPFTVVAHTLVEYYCISKHDLFGKLSNASIASIQQRVSKFPDEQTVKNAHAVSAGWKTYKADLIQSIIENRKSNHKDSNTIGAQSQLKARHLGKQLKSAVKKDTETRPAGRPSRPSFGKKERVSVFERKRLNTGASMNEAKAYSQIINDRFIKDKMENKEEDSDVVDLRKEANKTSDALSEKRESEKRKIQTLMEKRKDYFQVAQEMDEFLQDGFTLTRHVYENALSEGARYYCKSIAWF